MNKLSALFLCILMLPSALSCSRGTKQLFNDACDVGAVSHPGSCSFDSQQNVYTLTGAGVNLWGNTDACYFVWKKVTGDFSISGAVKFEGEGVNPHRKIGFMIRESLAPDSRYADIAIHGDGLTSLQYRPVTGEITSEEKSAKVSKGETSICLVRSGNRIAMRTSSGDPLPDSDDAAIEMDLPQECYVGLFICSHEEDLKETAYFSNVVLKQKKM